MRASLNVMEKSDGRLLNHISMAQLVINNRRKGSDKVPRSKGANFSESIRKKSRPALTPEARENQLVSLAVDLAEQQLRDGTASSQVITHYLKLGSTTAKLEKEKLRIDNELASAKIKAMESMANMEEVYKNAINAMKLYSGNGGDRDGD